jgi:nuclear polyadenylated RNA-binding protein NAB2
MNPAMPPDFEAFMMAGGMPPEMVQQMMMTAANIPNPMFSGFGGMNLADRITGDGSTGIVVAGGDRARCRHWPRCQLGARCKFHHPSQICPYHSLCIVRLLLSDFPNCPNLGGTCQYIHVGVDMPESDVQKVVSHQLTDGRPVNGHKTNSNSNFTSNGTSQRQEKKPAKAKPKKPQEQVPLCKFGVGCTKPDCPFAHPTPAAGTDGLVLRGEMCPDGRDCLNQEVFPISIFFS